MSTDIWAGEVGQEFFYCPYCTALYTDVAPYDLHMLKCSSDHCALKVLAQRGRSKRTMKQKRQREKGTK